MGLGKASRQREQQRQIPKDAGGKKDAESNVTRGLGRQGKPLGRCIINMCLQGRSTPDG